MWTAAILAGGQARRLGGLEKSALPLAPADVTGTSRAILEHQVDVLRGLTPHIMIVTRPNTPGRSAHPVVSGAQVVTDLLPGTGALGGIYTALMEAPTDQVLVLACDMPFITAPLLQALVDRGAAAAVDAVVPRDDRGRHPLCASYRRRVAPRLRARLDSGRLRVLDALADLAVDDFGPHELAALDAEGRLLFNVYTPDDYVRAQQRSAYHE